jgi:hypothetical protein
MQQLTLNAKGLYSFPNPLGTVPQGALSLAQNTIIDRDDTIETRRGLVQYGTLLAHPFEAMYNFNTTLMGWDTNNQFFYDSDGAGTWLGLTGSYAAPSGVTRIKGAEASGNMYFATSTGVIGLTAPNSTLYFAGVPFPLDSTAVLNTVVGGWFGTGETVGYRMVLGYTDANNNLHISAPAQRLVISNPGGGSASTVTLTWYIPPNLPLGYFYQIYRTRQVADIGGIPQDPGDEEYLVVQKTLTSTDISNKFITYTDVTPDVLLGQVLYTNPSQQTIAGANYQPPLAKDITYYQGVMLYANTTTRQQTIINMIAVPADGQSITIGGVTYTAAATENASIGQFKAFTSGTTGQNIDNTARSLVHVINFYSSNTYYWAIYTSGYTSLPGQITLQERGIGGTSFAVTATDGTDYSPQIPVSGTMYSSSNNVNPHYVYTSKVQIPEAVPIDNFIPIGTSDKPIIRILALRASIFVFKEDGIWRILGTDITNFSVSLFDSTVILTAPDSAVLLNNQIWCMTNQGVVAVSDSGTVIMSRPIERDLITLSSSIYPNFASSTFGIRYESDRHYDLCTNTATTDTHATQIWVNNFLTSTWNNWPLSITAGIVSLAPDDHLYLCYSTGQVVRERKNWNIFDYADFQYPVTISASSGLSVTVNSTTNIAVGDSLYQVDGLGLEVGLSIITAVVDSTHILVTDVINWISGAATVYQPIPVVFQYQPVGGNFAWVKHFQDFQAFFRDVSFTDLQFGFTSDFYPTNVLVPIPPSTGVGFGILPFGDEPYGGTSILQQVIRTYVPRNTARAHWITPSVTHSEAISNFALTGINLYFQYVSARQK